MIDSEFMTVVIRDNSYVFSLLEEFSAVLWKTDAQNMTIKEFYDTWRDKNNIPEVYNINTFTNLVRFIYAGILVPKEVWFKKIDDVKLSKLNGEWGIEESDCCYSGGRKIGLRECITRIRNAVAHAEVKVNVPEDEYFAPSLLYEKTEIIFTDVDKYGNGGTFIAKLSAKKVIALINKLSQLSEESYIEEWKKEVKGR